MGKRKSSSKPQPKKKREPLPTNFTCLFCNHERSVHVKIDKKAGTGNLDCRTCGQRFQCSVNYLSAPIDVYSEWVDAADEITVNKPGGPGLSQHDSMGRTTGGRARGPSTRRDTNDEDDSGGYQGEGIVDDDDDLI